VPEGGGRKVHGTIRGGSPVGSIRRNDASRVEMGGLWFGKGRGKTRLLLFSRGWDVTMEQKVRSTSLLLVLKNGSEVVHRAQLGVVKR